LVRQKKTVSHTFWKDHLHEQSFFEKSSGTLKNALANVFVLHEMSFFLPEKVLKNATTPCSFFFLSLIMFFGNHLPILCAAKKKKVFIVFFGTDLLVVFDEKMFFTDLFFNYKFLCIGFTTTLLQKKNFSLFF
jgi:hypothetical protein